MAINIVALFFFRFVFSFDNWFSFFTAAILRLTDLWGSVDFRVLALPAAIVVSSIFELLALMLALKRKIGALDGRQIANSVLRIVFASLGGGLIAYFFLQYIDRFVPTEKFWGIFSQGLIAGLLGLGGYVALGYVLNLEEMFIFISSLKRRLFKSVQVIAEDSINEIDRGWR